MPLAAALPALLLFALAFARNVRQSRARPGRPPVSFLDLPLGLAVTVRLDRPAVAVRERARSALLAAGGFRVEAEASGKLSFRRDRPSPWLGALWQSTPPAVYAGSLVAEPAQPSGCRLLVRFSTVPVAGWALLGLTLAGGLAGAAWATGHRGLWLWVAALALGLAIRAGYQAEARKLAWALIEMLGL